jgi:hypothetical protein
MDLLFNQEQIFCNSTLADLETSYHLLTSIYYKNSLNLTISGGFRGGVRGVLPPKIRKAYVIQR